MRNITFEGKSDTGLVRANNEDAFLISADLGFAAIADGMGGAAAGEIASRYFVTAALEVFSHNNGERAQSLLQKTFELANRKILDHSLANPDHKGMGCTAELLTFFDRNFALGHVGDSRTYLFRGGKLEHLTRDHSFVQELIDRGVISAEEARRHPMRHVILRAVGQGETLEVELVQGGAFPGDIFLLCSDGLTDMVEDSLIESILGEPTGLDRKARKLVDVAKSSGGHDNITVVLCMVGKESDQTKEEFCDTIINT